MSKEQKQRNFELERNIIFAEMKERLVWSDFDRYHELLMLLTELRQEEGKN